ncbi:WD40/YVTN/BNR-like repeat-containing protein [Tropicimonas marinistellae]|uniref:WD40/YVTN/BNR-like repeat-containing protein n=1 Tax=Tropicimonas marinistellae TaxID=1739787 RepID=UPI001F23215C|nr:exo-alpha-sialidase [Tropicimonas marinistellae]
MAPQLRAATPAGYRALAFSGGGAVAAGDSFLTSEDGGATWRQGARPGASPVALAAHPERSGRLIVALEGGGVAVSDNRGETLILGGRGLPAAEISALATAARLPDTLYAAIPGDGLWRSEDAGESWEFVMDRPFIAGEERDVLSLASVDLASGMGGIWLYGGSTAGLQRVPDCFCRWQDVQPEHALDALVEGAEAPEPRPLPAGEPVRALISSAAAPSRLWAALPSGIWISADAGLTWETANAIAATALAGDPTNPDTLIAASPDGLFHSRDAGRSWTASTIL